VANVMVLETVVSKSKSKPSITEVPKGRRAVEEVWMGPNMAQISWAAVVAAEGEVKPPSV